VEFWKFVIGSPMDFERNIRASERESEISEMLSGRANIFQKVYCDLATAQPSNRLYRVTIPFRSIFVRDATDSTAVVYFSPNENSIGNVAEALPLYKNDTFDFARMIAGGYFWWDAQAGKTMSIYVSTMGAMRAGSQLSQISGGFSISDGSAIASNKLTGEVATIACPAGAATQILSADSDRKVMNLYIDGAAWIGDASVAPNARGTLVQPGIITINSTALLYLYPAGGATVNVYGNDYR